MNTKELVKHYEDMSKTLHVFLVVAISRVLEDLRQLDEPQKVTIPQFVADWIDNMKCQGKTLYYGLDHTPPEEVDLWFCEDEVNRQNTFARAWLDGYEIQGRKYVVTDGNHLYFKGYQEDVDIVILVDDQPGTIDYVKKFDTREEAQKVADILGWKVQEVQDDSKI